MKKIFMLLAVISVFSLSSFAQSKWFFSIESGAAVGGPKASLMNNMRSSGFGDKESVQIIIFSWENEYPSGERYPPILAKFGKKIKENKSLYVLAGIPTSGHVSGFKSYSYEEWFFFGSSTGINMDVDYKLYQLAAGYQFSNDSNRIKLSVGPSVFAYHYKYSHNKGEESYTTFLPGANLSLRLPIGREKRLIGVDIIAEANLLPPVKMKEVNDVIEIDGKSQSYRYQQDKVNLMNGILGIALSFRR